MNRIRECGCKGRRSCLWCEEQYDIVPDFSLSENSRNSSYVYCPQCDAAWPGWDESVLRQHPNHMGEKITFPGIHVTEDFLSEQEAKALLAGIDGEPWDISQSGRRKQNYGPKCNFKKKRLETGNFTGFPTFSTFVQRKLNDVPLLRDYYVIEQCSLEYDPVKGACIDPHIDDCWVWGERVVTVNVLGDSFLTLTPYTGDKNKYNLDLVADYVEIPESDSMGDIVVRVPMPARSLIVMYGVARYRWEHFVLREDIKTRRVCLAYRDFTPPYLPGGKDAEKGKDILSISQNSSGLTNCKS